MRTTIYILLLIFFAPSQANSQSHFRENKGQWPSEVLFQMPLSSGAVYIQEDGFVFSMLDVDDLEYNNYLLHRNEPTGTVKGHAWKMAFVDCNEHFGVENTGKSSEYYNYFLGNDKSKWASEVHGFEEVLLTSVWDQIDVRAYRKQNKGKQVFKYDFIVHPGGDPENIQLKLLGADGVNLEEGNVVLKTSVGPFKELSPYSYQGGKEVKSAWRKNGNMLSFELDDYDLDNDLIIDPVLVAASYLGAGSEVWGYGSAFHSDGTFFSSGSARNPVHPTTLGAFQSDYAGGFDMALTRWNENASALLWSSYLGGNEEDEVANMAVNAQGELFVLAFTESEDFPLSENSFEGETSVYSVTLSRFASDGQSIIASAILSGAAPGTVNSFNNFSYLSLSSSADILIDTTNQPIVCFSAVQSSLTFNGSAFISSTNEFAPILIMRLNEQLNEVVNGTFFESSHDLDARSLAETSSGEIVLAGNIEQTSNQPYDLPTTNGAYLQSSLDPSDEEFYDGFIAKFSSDFSTLIACTVVSSLGPDRIWNMALDSDDDVWVLGLTEGDLIVIENGYYDPNSPLFIAEFESDLSNMTLCTSVGAGDGFNSEVLVPTAFMVDNCDRVYFSAHAAGEEFTNLTLTEDAYQTQGGFYLAQYEAGMTDLLYATLMGGTAHRWQPK